MCVCVCVSCVCVCVSAFIPKCMYSSFLLVFPVFFPDFKYY